MDLDKAGFSPAIDRSLLARLSVLIPRKHGSLPCRPLSTPQDVPK
jgi:hypothetical protein